MATSFSSSFISGVHSCFAGPRDRAICAPLPTGHRRCILRLFTGVYAHAHGSFAIARLRPLKAILQKRRPLPCRTRTRTTTRRLPFPFPSWTATALRPAASPPPHHLPSTPHRRPHVVEGDNIRSSFLELRLFEDLSCHSRRVHRRRASRS